MKVLIALLVALLPLSALSDERILSFHSDVVVRTDGIIEVTETIKVRAEGKAIRRGIYRDFPVEYRDHLGNIHEITVEPVFVTRNDQPEAYRSVRSNRDIRTYFGRSDYFLEHGEHVYVFRYRANRMLGFFEEHDELYWNVTGFRWAFAIDKATATVRLDFPVAREKLFVEGYTGPYGANQQNYTRELDEAGNVHFAAVGKLTPTNGLTIVVGWPKGYVAAPTRLQRIFWLLEDNRDLMIAVIGLLLLLAYYLPIWMRYGKDPAAGVIVTRYEPPSGYSPASLRYIRQMYYDDKVMTAAVVNLAVKGYLKIVKSGSSHRLEKIESSETRPDLAPGEKELYDGLFKKRKKITLQNANHSVLGAAKSAHQESLLADYRKKYFRTNGWLNIPAIIIVIGSTILALRAGGEPTRYVIMTIVAMFAIMSFFAIIMRRPTIRGRKLLDEMLGFKEFLEIAEKDELNLRNPPKKTPELFEMMLPFALALGVDQKWSERFAKVLASIQDPDGNDYSPSWYNGSWSSVDLASNASQLSSDLNSDIGSSVSPPGSSSGGSGGGGGGGGGSSGGGGGGGGGGGW